MRHLITKRFLLEEEQLDWLKLSREQVIVRSTFRSVNQTLYDIATHETLLTKELRKILNSVNVGNKKIEGKYASTALYLAVNWHAIRLRQAIGEVKDVYDNHTDMLTLEKMGLYIHKYLRQLACWKS
jgi:hypothetical protein